MCSCENTADQSVFCVTGARKGLRKKTLKKFWAMKICHQSGKLRVISAYCGLLNKRIFKTNCWKILQRTDVKDDSEKALVCRTFISNVISDIAYNESSFISTFYDQLVYQ